MAHLLFLFFGAAIVTNFVLVRFLGLIPFFGVSNTIIAALGIYLPLITTNCVVLGLVLLQNSLSYTFVEAIVFALGAGVGFTLVLVLFSAIRERLAIADVPEPFKNTAIALITAGLLSLSFMGFAGFTGSAA